MRKSIKWFAKEMERKCAMHDKEKFDNGWHDYDYDYFLSKIMLRLKRILRNRNVSDCVDIANFAMMIADNIEKEGKK